MHGCGASKGQGRIKRFLSLKRLIVIAFFLTAGGPALADDWAEGNAAFMRGDFGSALALFESARDAGQPGPAVHYNIAVCQYKLARYRDAGQTFAQLAREYPRMAGLAEYNLGLVARMLGDEILAADHFLRAYDLSPDDEKIRILASNRLAEIDIDTPWQGRLRGAFGIGVGYDDNVVLRDTDVISREAVADSGLTDLFASVSGPISSRVEQLSFDASLYAVRYFDADEFDQHGLAASASYGWRYGEWQLSAGPQAGAGWIGGDAFDRSVGVRGTARRSLDDGGTLRFVYVFDDIREGDDLFQGIEGRRHLFDARYSRRFSGDQRIRIRVRYENNDRQDGGVSPTRVGFSADYGLPLADNWTLEGGLEWRRSRFDDALLPRDEDLLTIDVSVLRQLGRDWDLLLDVRFSNNDSDNPAFSYDRKAVTIGVMRSF